MKNLDSLLKNPLVYFIYESGLSIYGIDTPIKEYTILVDSKFSKKLEPEENEIYHIWYIDDWWKKLLNNDLICWEMSCLDKKFVLKEHVKLLCIFDGKQIKENVRNTVQTNPNDTVEGLFDSIKALKFAYQIMENHKIVNFNDVKHDYESLLMCSDDNEKLKSVGEHLISKYQEELKHKV